ncbi:MAG: hypothetical protein HXX17_04040 [Geobacteraceae bacterium]|nr:hypothetical protein [Geobacteraceae bacterium]
MFKVIGVIFGLFVVLFVAIIIEEVFVGGKRLRAAERAAKERQKCD